MVMEYMFKQKDRKNNVFPSINITNRGNKISLLPQFYFQPIAIFGRIIQF